MKTVKVIKNGTSVKIDHGSERYSYGTVISFDGKKRNQMGFKGNYKIEITGGVNVFNLPEKVGEIRNVLYSHVSEI